MKSDDQEALGKAWAEYEYPYWVATDKPHEMKCGNAWMSSKPFRWVVESDYKGVVEELDNVKAFYGQLEVRTKVMHGYIKFLEGLCRDKGIPLPETYTLSLDKATQPAPNTSVDTP